MAENPKSKWPKATDKAKLESISDTAAFKKAFDDAVKSFELWTVKKKFESCRFCTTCGGNYPKYAGEGLKKGDRGYWSKSRESCQGE